MRTEHPAARGREAPRSTCGRTRAPGHPPGASLFSGASLVSAGRAGRRGIPADRPAAAYTTRSTIIFLISAMALAGFSPLGQVLAQFMIVWQR